MPVRIIEPAAPAEPAKSRLRVLEPFAGAEPARATSQGLGFMEGLAEPLSKIPTNPLDLIPGLDTRPTRRKAEEGMERYFAEREKTQRPGTLGKIAGNIVGTAPVAAITKNPWAAGAASGALSSEADDAAGVVLDAGLGAVGGKLGDMGVNAVGRALKPAMDDAVKLLMSKGVKLTPGQIRGGKAMAREDRMMSRPVVGPAISEGRARSLDTFNRAAVDEALTPLGVKLPAEVNTGHDAVAFAGKAVSKAYDAIVPNLTFTAKPDDVLAAAADDLATLPKPQASQFRAIVKSTLKDGNLVGKSVQTAQSELKRLASTYSGSANASEREMGRALWDVATDFEEALVAQNPMHAPALKEVNKAFRGLAIVQDAASRADEGVVTTSGLRQAARRSDGSRRKVATAEGRGFMQDFTRAGRKVLPSQTPNSATADRMLSGNTLENLLGLARAAAYRIDEKVAPLAAQPRPAWADPAADALLKLRPLLRLGGGAAPVQRKP